MNPSKNTIKKVVRWAKADHENKEMPPLRRNRYLYEWVIGFLVKQNLWDFDNQKLK